MKSWKFELSPRRGWGTASRANRVMVELRDTRLAGGDGTLEELDPRLLGGLRFIVDWVTLQDLPLSKLAGDLTARPRPAGSEGPEYSVLTLKLVRCFEKDDSKTPGALLATGSGKRAADRTAVVKALQRGWERWLHRKDNVGPFLMRSRSARPIAASREHIFWSVFPDFDEAEETTPPVPGVGSGF